MKPMIKFSAIQLGEEFETGADADGMEPYYYKVSETEGYVVSGMHQGIREEIKPGEEFLLTGKTYPMRTTPDAIEIIALTILSRAPMGHPALRLWVHELTNDPNELRDIDTFAQENHPYLDEKYAHLSIINSLKQNNWNVENTMWGDSVFGPIIEHKQKPSSKKSKDDQLFLLLDEAALRLAQEVRALRTAGRVAGERTSTIQGMGAPLMTVITSLDAAICEYTSRVISAYEWVRGPMGK